MLSTQTGQLVVRGLAPLRSDRLVGYSVRILAIDDLRLLRMQHQLAGRKAIRQRTPELPRLLGASAVTNRFIRITLEGDVREVPRHPHIERVVHEQIRQQGTNYALNAKDNLRLLVCRTCWI